MNAWQLVAAIAAVMAPLIGVPLTMITLYLRSLREQQVVRITDLAQRLDAAESAVRRCDQQLANVQRDYTSKEEWLRETMWARNRIERLAEAMSRAEAQLENVDALLAAAERTGRLVASINDRMETLQNVPPQRTSASHKCLDNVSTSTADDAAVATHKEHG